jgi:anti-sigma regulatory factor (Ser/Thr protein kinase)
MRKRWRIKRGDYASAPAQRAAFRELLSSNGLQAKAPVCELVFGELMTNAMKYGTEPMYVDVQIAPDSLRIKVDDSGGCFDLGQAMRKPPDQEGGRGLHIVKAIATKLTVERTPRFNCEVTAVLKL